MECYSCKSNSGELRISPGAPVFEGLYWWVEHAYPCGLEGWLVLVLKRHAEALHELGEEETRELGLLQGRAARALYDELGSEKEYSALFAEAEHFNHVHFHVIAKPYGLPEELRATKIFNMLRAEGDSVVPPEVIAGLCERLKARFEAMI